MEVQLQSSQKTKSTGGGGMVGTEPASPEAQSLALLGLVRETPPLTSGPMFCPLSTGPTESAQG